MTAPRRTGLILTGGGARAAYQVGVLSGIAELLGPHAPNPFAVLCGTSAGAINAAALAARADAFTPSVDHLVEVWRSFRAHQVYRCDVPAITRTGGRWLLAMMLVYRLNPISLLDNRPLRAMLSERIDFSRIARNIDSGALHAVSVTASGYTSGRSVTFYQAHDQLEPWERPQRIGVRTELGVDHLMASSALPFLFPAVRLQREYFGDGSMRQIAPISPALHLGADRVLVIGTGRQAVYARRRSILYPSVAQIAGHALNSIFLDTLVQDIEWLQRINRMLAEMPPESEARRHAPFRHIDVLVIAPSQSIELIAASYVHELPRTIRFLLGGVGGLRRPGSNLTSYLLFEPGFCRALLELGYHDALTRKREVLAFLRPQN
jgi:NTE family protein